MTRLLLICCLAMTSCLTQFDQVRPDRKRITRDNHRFPVATGLHGQMDCDDCHGPYETFTQFSCITCHDHEQTATTASHSAVATFTWTEASCYDCHSTGQILDRGSHAPFLPILTGPHEETECNECHIDGYDTFDCISCHEHRCAEMDDKHSEVADYACDSVRCLECHPQGRHDD